MGSFEHDGLTLCYDERGRPDTPPVVLLHGLGTDLRMWHPIAVELSAYYHVVCLDLRGSGCSGDPAGPARYAVEHLAGDVIALTDHLALGIFALGGWDLGGTVALHAAAAVPERLAALVLADTCAGGPPRLWLGTEYLERIRRWGAAGLAYRERMASTGGTFLDSARASLHARLNPEALLAAVTAWRAAPDPVPLHPEPPVLLLRSEKSVMEAGMKGLAARFSGPRIITVRGSEGAAPLHAPDTTARVLREFLGDVEQGRPVAGDWAV